MRINAANIFFFIITVFIPLPALSQTGMMEVEKIWTTPVELTFSGFIEINNEYTFKVRSNIPDTQEGLTGIQFLKMGDSIFGYEIDYLAMQTAEYLNPDGSKTEKDESFLLLKRGKESTLKLFINTPAKLSEITYIATLKNSSENLWPGKSFWAENNKYLVSEISKDKVFLDCNGEKIILEKGLASEDTGSVLYFEYNKKKAK